MLLGSLRLVSVTSLAVLIACGFAATAASAADSGVAVLLADTDRVAGTLDERIYGHFLEEISHELHAIDWDTIVDAIVTHTNAA